jgi:dihydroorotate dehydrogenase
MSQVHDLAAGMLRGLDPETAHTLTIQGLKTGLGPRFPARKFANLSTTVGGLSFPNVVGLAAGFDKNAEVPGAMLSAGFGFVECGTVTPLPQVGNPRPRLFRLSEDGGVINRMGFNNAGLVKFRAHLPRHRSGPIGANVGANKDSNDRIGDYVLGLESLWGLCDYFTLNISSPNTPGLRALQTRTALEELLGRVDEARIRLQQPDVSLPIFLKIAPDLDEAEIEVICESVARSSLEAIIVGNTTLDRPPELKSSLGSQSGGLSGAPLQSKARRTLSLFHAAKSPGTVLIAAGGISSGAEAFERIRLGASLVQLYSAMVFEGPGLVARILEDLAARLAAEGFATVADAVGTGKLAR